MDGGGLNFAAQVDTFFFNLNVQLLDLRSNTLISSDSSSIITIELFSDPNCAKPSTAEIVGNQASLLNGEALFTSLKVKTVGFYYFKPTSNGIYSNVIGSVSVYDYVVSEPFVTTIAGTAAADTVDGIPLEASIDGGVSIVNYGTGYLISTLGSSTLGSETVGPAPPSIRELKSNSLTTRFINSGDSASGFTDTITFLALNKDQSTLFFSTGTWKGIYSMSTATFANPVGIPFVNGEAKDIAVDSFDNVFILDSYCNNIKILNNDNSISVVAGGLWYKTY